MTENTKTTKKQKNNQTNRRSLKKTETRIYKRAERETEENHLAQKTHAYSL